MGVLFLGAVRGGGRRDRMNEIVLASSGGSTRDEAEVRAGF